MTVKNACTSATVEARSVPLDLYLMVDRSASMAGVIDAQGGVDKWHAVTEGLSAFLASPASADIGVGLQVFPSTGSTAVTSCLADADCGPYPPCNPSTVCETAQTPCWANLDCPNGEACVAPLPAPFCTPVAAVYGPCTSTADCAAYYSCSKDVETGTGTCIPYYGPCSTDANCPDAFTCVHPDPTPQQAGFCSVPYLGCDAATYAAPRVEIAPVSTAAPALLQALGTVDLWGNTPMAPALEGAVTHVRSWAAAQPTRQAVAVLVTDGTPTECAPLGSVVAAASAGLAGSPPVRTFVIAIFSEDDDAYAGAAMNKVADAGGTGEAYVLKPDENLTNAVLDALKAVREAAVPCKFPLPAAPSDGDVDYFQMSVTWTSASPGVALGIPYVGEAGWCDKHDGGWYYDVDPETGATPTQILVCGATCGQLASGGHVDVEMGCADPEGPPPK